MLLILGFAESSNALESIFSQGHRVPSFWEAPLILRGERG